MSAEEPVTLTYTNWKGVTAQRTILPKGLRFGSTEWHPEPQWLVLALDVEKGEEREFALKDIGPRPDGADQIAELEKDRDAYKAIATSLSSVLADVSEVVIEKYGDEEFPSPQEEEALRLCRAFGEGGWQAVVMPAPG